MSGTKLKRQAKCIYTDKGLSGLEAISRQKKKNNRLKLIAFAYSYSNYTDKQHAYGELNFLGEIRPWDILGFIKMAENQNFF